MWVTYSISSEQDEIFLAITPRLSRVSLPRRPGYHASTGLSHPPGRSRSYLSASGCHTQRHIHVGPSFVFVFSPGALTLLLTCFVYFRDIYVVLEFRAQSANLSFSVFITTYSPAQPCLAFFACLTARGSFSESGVEFGT